MSAEITDEMWWYLATLPKKEAGERLDRFFLSSLRASFAEELHKTMVRDLKEIEEMAHYDARAKFHWSPLIEDKPRYTHFRHED